MAPDLIGCYVCAMWLAGRKKSTVVVQLLSVRAHKPTDLPFQRPLISLPGVRSVCYVADRIKPM